MAPAGHRGGGWPGSRSALAVALALAALAIVAAQALAAAGALDDSFSGDGKQLTRFDPTTGLDDEGEAVAIQPDGKLVVAGSSEQGSGSTGQDFGIARYNPNGSLDDSFSGDGRRVQSFDNGNRFDTGEAVAIQPNGKIVVAGFSNQGPSDDAEDLRNQFAIARYNPDGSLDDSFSGDGKRLVVFNPDFDQAFDVAIQPDGKIVVVGESFSLDNPPFLSPHFAVARLNPNGSLDDSFAGDGKRLTVMPTNVTGKASGADGVAIQSNGKIVVAGSSLRAGGSYNFAVARYRPNGSLDDSFSGDGKRVVELGDDDNGADVAIQRNGRIVVAGSSEQDTEGDAFALVRLRPNGTLDDSFHGDGKRLATFAAGSGEDQGRGVAIQRDGRIVVVGESDQQDTGNDLAVARFTPAGDLDDSFSGNGKRLVTFGPAFTSDRGYAVAIQRNGRIVAAGRSFQAAPEGTRFAVARLLGG